MVLLLAGFVAAAACDKPRTSAEVDLALAAAEFSWGVDEPGFQRAVAAAADALPCVEDPVTVAFAARCHRVLGLRAFLAGDDASASRAFAASIAADPAYTFPETMVPAENPLRALYEGARSLPTTTQEIPPPAGRSSVRIDGVATRARPTFRPTILQLVTPDGRAATAWLATDAPLPDYRLRGQGLRAPLLVTAGTAAVASGVLLGLAWVASDDLEGASSLDDAEAARDTVNALSIASAGVGAIAVGSAAGAFLFARW